MRTRRRRRVYRHLAHHHRANARGAGIPRRRERGHRGERERWIARLEDYQRDLEEEVADVASEIKRLKDATAD